MNEEESQIGGAQSDMGGRISSSTGVVREQSSRSIASPILTPPGDLTVRMTRDELPFSGLRSLGTILGATVETIDPDLVQDSEIVRSNLEQSGEDLLFLRSITEVVSGQSSVAPPAILTPIEAIEQTDEPQPVMAEPEGPILARDVASLPTEVTTERVFPSFYDLPPPEVVIADPTVASSVRNSQFIEQLPVVNRSLIVELGVVELRGASGTVTITPFAQIMFRMISMYYAFLSPAGYSESAARLIHYVHYSSCQATGDVNTQGIQDAYTLVTSYGWESIIPLLARLLYPEAVLSNPNLMSVVTPTTFQTSLLNLQNVYLEAHRLYIVLAHLCSGGEQTIGPLPEWLNVDDCIQRYVDGISRGNSSVSRLSFSIRPRPANVTPLPFTPFDVGRGTSQESSITINRPTVVQEPVIDVLPQLGARAPVSEAIRQIGEPGRVQVVRNTDSFREGTERLLSFENRLAELSATVIAQSATLDRLMQFVEQSAERLTGIERSLTLLTAQASRTDLMGRQNLNQTLLATTPSVETTRIIQTAPTQLPLPISQASILLQDINALDEFPDRAAEIAQRVRMELENRGHASLAANVSPSYLLQPRARQRVSSVLSNVIGSSSG